MYYETMIKAILVFAALTCFGVARAESCKEVRICDDAYKCVQRNVCTKDEAIQDDSPAKETVMQRLAREAKERNEKMARDGL